eukprot:18827-Heterococcus_DN1.PRE.1
MADVESLFNDKACTPELCESCSYNCCKPDKHQYCHRCKRKLGFFGMGTDYFNFIFAVCYITCADCLLCCAVRSLYQLTKTKCKYHQQRAFTQEAIMLHVQDRHVVAADEACLNDSALDGCVSTDASSSML